MNHPIDPNISLEIFDKVRIPMVLWKVEKPENEEEDVLKRASKPELICYYTNGRVRGVSRDTRISDYLRNGVEHAELYTDLTKGSRDLTTATEDIALEQFGDRFFLEMHYPRLHNVHILSTINKKLRTPLTNIIGLLSIIKDSNFGAEEKKHMAIFRQSCYSVIALANDLIDVVDLESKGIRLEIEKVDLRALLLHCISLQNSDGSAKNGQSGGDVSIRLSVDIAVPTHIETDASRLQQVVGNLLKNAVQHTDVGRITVSVSILDDRDLEDCPYPNRCRPPSLSPRSLGSTLLFRIKDNGTGMDADKKKEIECMLEGHDYDCMYRQGFGLTLANRICRLMGGCIWFKTQKDIGTVFYFTIVTGDNLRFSPGPPSGSFSTAASSSFDR